MTFRDALFKGLIKTLARIMWVWDVIFTAIDIFQLKVYYLMRNALCKLEVLSLHKAPIKTPKNIHKPLESWDDN